MSGDMQDAYVNCLTELAPGAGLWVGQGSMVGTCE